MMRLAPMKLARLCLALLVAASSALPAFAQQQAIPPLPTVKPESKETVQSDISTREIAIQSNFTGIEILVFGSIDFSDSRTPGEGTYDVIAVVNGPDDPIVVRKKQRIAGIWVNSSGRTFDDVPGFYAVLSTRPIRAIASDETLKRLGIGLSELEFGRGTLADPQEQAYRSALIRLMEEDDLFQEDDDGVKFVGRSLFRATVALPVNVPTGRYLVDVYLFRDGELASKSHATLQVTKAGIEALLHWLALDHPFLYGLLGIAIAVMMGLIGWYAFRRD